MIIFNLESLWFFIVGYNSAEDIENKAFPWGNGGSGSLSNLLKVTELADGWSSRWTQTEYRVGSY